MAEKLFPYRHRTLGALRDAGLRLHAFCLTCTWDADLNIPELIERLGPRQSAAQPDIVPKLVCSQCGSKDIAVVLTAADNVPADTAEHVRKKWKVDPD